MLAATFLAIFLILVCFYVVEKLSHGKGHSEPSEPKPVPSPLPDPAPAPTSPAGPSAPGLPTAKILVPPIKPDDLKH
jgi:hypothetical protein